MNDNRIDGVERNGEKIVNQILARRKEEENNKQKKETENKIENGMYHSPS